MRTTLTSTRARKIAAQRVHAGRKPKYTATCDCGQRLSAATARKHFCAAAPPSPGGQPKATITCDCGDRLSRSEFRHHKCGPAYDPATGQDAAIRLRAIGRALTQAGKDLAILSQTLGRDPLIREP